MSRRILALILSVVMLFGIIPANVLAVENIAEEAELSYQQAQLVATKAELKDQLAQLQSGKMQLESTLSILKALQNGLNELTQQADAMAAEIDALLQLQYTAQQLEPLRQAMQERLEQIKNDAALTQEQINAAIAEFMSSPEYQEIETQWAQLKVALTAYGIDIEGIEERLQISQEAYRALKERIAAMEESLSQQNISKETLDQQIAEMENNLVQLDQGAAAIQDGLAQIDSGMLQLQDAANLLNQQKENGVAIIFVGEDLDVLIDLCDRILVLCDGKVSGIVDGRKTTKEEVGLLMTKLGGEKEACD